jgi:hypothetical protein
MGPQAGTRLCQEAHVGVVTAGQAGVRTADGREFLLRAGDAYVIPGGRDSWVVGDRHTSPFTSPAPPTMPSRADPRVAELGDSEHANRRAAGQPQPGRGNRRP